MGTGKAVAAGLETVTQFTGISSDSRRIKPGYLFAAISGAKGDGASFVADAVARGAVAVLGRPEIGGVVKAAGAQFIAAENPRLALAEAAALYFGAQPETVAAVTGTNGKTSIAVFLREIWTHLGKKAASMGTIGVVTPTGLIKLDNTTPGPLEVHEILAALEKDGVEHLALEASSHGLDQYRLDGVKISAVGFTNLTRDHLDYHASLEAYLEAKLRLFRELAEDGAAAVVNADAEYSEHFVAVASQRGLRLITVGAHGGGIKLIARKPSLDGQELHIAFAGQTYTIALPLAGAFQASNALVAAGMAIGLGEDPASVFKALEHLKGAPGRLEKVAIAASGAPIFVDYAHTPDALETVLTALRPHTERKLVVVFGCGGDRDKGKRPLMGAIAARLADRIIVTDDNPRTEDSATIRSEILAAAPGAAEIDDRAQAIHTGISELSSGDVLVIAGKGHESGQIVGATVHPFLDRAEAVKAAIALGGQEYLP
ncbi:UDP-N-acetylmuramoyl-L-alanyl-D-glutamate--2,6-diaminopimelate ligase [Rhizomicrobium palustre]|uniref:UDP-N-acetylmuramoyl-L-alanyl-D-glutamate--2,6-diaminopimelate ligase n=1 Tax=Rhizomicrobium palustre TaxID=189966 RepID=A0A846MVV3_9PROT|nr:UDP-N-acetylmuramoyl-L-alanyl-D-glutamate--2,6-diaminopimelate ligase [Rhizomicrobium palustre]NIK87506.1 UDP-N-acetylmuramoyl-L-alanyl-D-glutamate--2,6-diaminopimelate ligase [Rhizomicrobium palustre]